MTDLVQKAKEFAKEQKMTERMMRIFHHKHLKF